MQSVLRVALRSLQHRTSHILLFLSLTSRQSHWPPNTYACFCLRAFVLLTVPSPSCFLSPWISPWLTSSSPFVLFPNVTVSVDISYLPYVNLYPSPFPALCFSPTLITIWYLYVTYYLSPTSLYYNVSFETYLASIIHFSIHSIRQCLAHGRCSKIFFWEKETFKKYLKV